MSVRSYVLLYYLKVYSFFNIQNKSYEVYSFITLQGLQNRIKSIFFSHIRLAGETLLERYTVRHKPLMKSLVRDIECIYTFNRTNAVSDEIHKTDEILILLSRPNRLWQIRQHRLRCCV